MPRVLIYKTHGLPEDAIYIGREIRRYGLPDSRWANQSRLRHNATREERAEVIRQYEQHLHDSGLINQVRDPARPRSRVLSAPKPCHGDVLLRLANE